MRWGLVHPQGSNEGDSTRFPQEYRHKSICEIKSDLSRRSSDKTWRYYPIRRVLREEGEMGGGQGVHLPGARWTPRWDVDPESITTLRVHSAGSTVFSLRYQSGVEAQQAKSRARAGNHLGPPGEGNESARVAADAHVSYSRVRPRKEKD